MQQDTSPSAQPQSKDPIVGLYGGGSLYGGIENVQQFWPYLLSQPGMERTLQKVKSSGFNRVILRELMIVVDQPATPPNVPGFEKYDIYMYAPVVSSWTPSKKDRESRYIGPAHWPRVLADLKDLGSVEEVFFCFGAGWDHLHDHPEEMKPDGTIYQNFQALRQAIPAIDGIDFDFEGTKSVNRNFPKSYVDTIVSFALMLQEIGYSQVTFCPGQSGGDPEPSAEFWAACWDELETRAPGYVTGINLQCYGDVAASMKGWLKIFNKQAENNFQDRTPVTPGVVWAASLEQADVTGNGRVVIGADAGWLGNTDSDWPGPGQFQNGDNPQYALNTLAWLGRLR